MFSINDIGNYCCVTVASNVKFNLGNE